MSTYREDGFPPTTPEEAIEALRRLRAEAPRGDDPAKIVELLRPVGEPWTMPEWDGRPDGFDRHWRNVVGVCRQGWIGDPTLPKECEWRKKSWCMHGDTWQEAFDRLLEALSDPGRFPGEV